MFIFIKQSLKTAVFLASSVFAVFGVMLNPPYVHAIAQGYSTEDTGLQTGMVASLAVEGSDDKVERATQDDSNRAVGVVTTIENSAVTVSSGTGKVLVESEGQVEAYVSDIGGAVHKGDLLTVSPLKGVLMRSVKGAPGKVIGVAVQDATETTTYQYTDGGVSKETQIAKIKVDLSVLGASNGETQTDSALAKLGKAIVGKDVGEIRVLIALIIFLIVLIAEGGILYGAISSAITALGRNPLARKIIRTELVKVVFVALAVLFVGLGSVYAILWI